MLGCSVVTCTRDQAGSGFYFGRKSRNFGRNIATRILISDVWVWKWELGFLKVVKHAAANTYVLDRDVNHVNLPTWHPLSL